MPPKKQPTDLKPLSHQTKHFASFFGQPSSSTPARKRPVASTSALKPDAVVEISSDSDSDEQKPQKKKAKLESVALKRKLLAKPATPVNESSSKSKGKERAVEQDVEGDTLWNDRFQPRGLEELAVHKKKVADVKHWLEEALDDPKLSKYRRLLVLSGPAGSAKTATIRVLAQEMSFELVEFRSGDGADSLTTQFNAFVSRAASVPTLDFNSTGLAKDNEIQQSPPKVNKKTSQQQSLLPQRIKSKSQNKRKIILVEDLPNVYTSDVTKSAFRTAISRFVQVNKGYSSGVPMVLIISETTIKGTADEWLGSGAGGSSNWGDNLSVRNLVPLDILKGGKAMEIKFNPIAITFMRKALECVLERAYPVVASKRAKIQRPTSEAIELVALAANGDIRNALNNLEFLVKEGATESALIQYSILADATKTKKRGRKDKNPKLNNPDLVALIGGREASLFLFHALGKVLFSKRWGDSPEDDEKDDRPRPPKTKKLPSHLANFERKPSKVDPNTLFADAPVDCDLFMAYLHQNYTPFNDSIEECAASMESFSQADAISRIEGERFTKHPLTSQYSFHIAVRGMLVSLPSPVPRRGQKMLKAEMWEKQKVARENDASLASLVIDLARSTFADAGEEGRLQSLLTRRTLAHELVPFLGIIKQPFSRQRLPQHTASVITDLVTFSNATSAKGQLLNEREVGDSDAEDDEDTVERAVVGEDSKQVDIEPQIQLLYLEEDDIEEF